MLVPASVSPVSLTAPLQPAALYLRAGFDRWSLPLLPSSLSHRGVAIVGMDHCEAFWYLDGG